MDRSQHLDAVAPHRAALVGRQVHHPAAEYHRRVVGWNPAVDEAHDVEVAAEQRRIGLVADQRRRRDPFGVHDLHHVVLHLQIVRLEYVAAGRDHAQGELLVSATLTGRVEQQCDAALAARGGKVEVADAQVTALGQRAAQPGFDIAANLLQVADILFTHF